MNYWKIAFVALLILSSVLFITMVYLILDQGVSLTYQREGYTDTKQDLDLLVNLINESNLKRADVIDIILENDNCSSFEEGGIFVTPCNRIEFKTDSAGILTVHYQW
jgi:hypothetical protein